MVIVSKPNVGGGRDYTSVTNKEAKRLVSSGSAEWNFKDKALEEERRKNQLAKEAQAGADFRYNMALEAQNKQIIQNSIDMEARKTQPTSLGLGPRRDMLPQGPQSSQLTPQQKQQYGLFQSSGPVSSVDPRTGRPYGTVTAATPEQSKAMRGSGWQGPKDFFAGIMLDRPPEEQTRKSTYAIGAAASLALPFDEAFKGYRVAKAGVGKAVTFGLSKAGKVGQAVKSSRAYPWLRTGTQAVVEGELAIQAFKVGSEKYTGLTSPQDNRASVKALGPTYREAFAEAIGQSEATLPTRNIGPVAVPTTAGGLVYGMNRFVGEKIFKVDAPKKAFRAEFEAALKRRGAAPLPGLLDYAEKERGSKVFSSLGAAVTIESVTENAARQGIKAGSAWVKRSATENVLKQTSKETQRQFYKSVGKEAFRRQLPVVLTASAAEGYLQYRADTKLFDQKFSPIGAVASAGFGGITGVAAQRFITVPSIDPKTRWQSKAARGVVEVFEMGQELSGDLLADARGGFMRTVTRKADFEPNVRIKPGKVSTATFSLQPAQPGISIPGISGKRFSVTGPGGFRLPSIGNIFKPGGNGPGATTPDTTSDSGGKSGTPQSIFNIGGPSVISSSTSTTSNAFSATSAFSISPSMSQFAPKIPPPVPIGLPAFKGGTQGKQAKRYVDELSMAFGKLQSDLSFGAAKRQKMSSFEIGNAAKRGKSKPKRWLF